MQEVVKQLSVRHLKNGGEVHVFTSSDELRRDAVIDGVIVSSFNISGNSVDGIIGEKSEILRFKKEILEGEFDVVTVFAAQHWGCDLFFEVMDNLNSVKVFVPTGFSCLYYPRFKSYYEEMKRNLSRFHLNIFLSHDYRDINFTKKLGLENYVVIPNGACEQEFLGQSELLDFEYRELGLSSDKKIILHVGSFTGLKGQDEAIEIFKKANLVNVDMILVGNIISIRSYLKCKLKALVYNLFNKNKIVLSTRITRDQTLKLYKIASVFLFPSRIECSPIVLFEACASRTPFLSSDVGNSVEISKLTGGGKILKTFQDKRGFSIVDVDEGARVLRELINNDSERGEIARRGYEAWLGSFTWEIIAQQYYSEYLRLIYEHKSKNI